MSKILFTIVIFSFSFVHVFSQTHEAPKKNKFIKIHTGIIIDTYNSAGPRLYLEYLSQFKPQSKWSWGISMENKWHAIEPATDWYAPPNVNSNTISYKVHYQANLIKQQVFWDISVGAGFTHLFWDEQHTIQPSLSIGVTLNIKLSPSITLETAPLLIFLPVSDIYISTSKAYNPNTGYAQFVFLPVGVKIKI